MRGQVVAAYRVDGAGDDGIWNRISSGTTIGYAKLDQFPPVSVQRLRVTIDDGIAEPERITLRAY
jgi:alpha-L-fucosidase